MIRAMNNKCRMVGASLLLSVLLGGCANNGAEHRPVVENHDLVYYESDLLKCQQLARSYDDAELLKGSVLGAITGALTGIGEGGEESMAGAAIGAVIGAAGGSLKANAERRKIVVQCMRDLGYNVKD